MDPSKKIVPPISDRADKTDGLTVMILGSVGSIRSFKLSRRSIIGVVIFFLLYIPSSIYLINEFFELRRNYNIQNTALDMREAELSEINQALLISNQHVALLNDYVQDLQKPEPTEQKNSWTSNENTIPQKVETPVVEDVPEVTTVDSPQTVVSPSTVDSPPPEYGNSVLIEDVVIQKQGSQMTVDFKLSNTKPDENTVGGYVHILAMADSSDRPQMWIYPKETLKNGLPSNFRRGELFYIKRFKQITGKIDLGSDQVRPARIKVLVYNQSGTLIYEKEYEVSNAT